MLLPVFVKLIPTWAWAATAALVVGFGAGAYTSHQFSEFSQARKEARVVKQIEKTKQKVETATTPIEHKAVAQQATIQAKERVIYREVVKYVPQKEEPNCPPLDLGTVRVLNAARQAQSPEDVVRATASLDETTSRTPTAVTRVELIQSDIAIALMYNDLASRHNALLDWIEAQQKALGNAP